MKHSLVLISILAFGACGGDDGGSGGNTGGVPGSTLLKDLTQAQTDALCHAEAAKSPEETIDCGNGETTTRGVDDAECTNAELIDVSDSCTATVNDLEDCFDDLDDLSDAELCDDSGNNIPESCAFLFQCSDTGSAVAPVATATRWIRAVRATR